MTLQSLFSTFIMFFYLINPCHNYDLEDYGLDIQAYPSYMNTIYEDEFGSSVSNGNEICPVEKLHHQHMGGIIELPKSANVIDFGAKGDGCDDDTEAFLKAWNEACSSPVDTVFTIPENKKYLVKPIRFSGPCKANLTVQIYGTIEASKDQADYSKDGKHWLVFEKVNNLLVEGGGTIDGNGNIWWQNSCKIDKTLPCKDAPTALTFHKCKNVVVKNLTIQNAQQIHVSFDHCTNVEAIGLNVTAPEKSPNTDGIHVTHSKNIKISNCVVGTGDDCISIVSGSKKVQVTDITCGPGHGISIGSLGKGNSEAHVSDILVDGGKLSGTTNGVRIKTWQGGSGSATNIRFLNIEMQNVKNPIIIDQNYCDQDKPCKEQDSAVQIQNVVYQNIEGTSASEVAIKLDCSKNHPCKEITLQDINLRLEGGGVAKALCNNVKINEIGFVSPHCSQKVK